MSGTIEGSQQDPYRYISGASEQAQQRRFWTRPPAVISVPSMPDRPASSRRSRPSGADLDAAERLRALWAQKPAAVTQQTVADLLGISQSAVSQFLRGHIALNFLAVHAFAQALGCDPEAIRADLPEQQFFRLYPQHKPRQPMMVREPDEIALVEKYRRADEAGKASLQAVGNALTQPQGRPGDKPVRSA